MDWHLLSFDFSLILLVGGVPYQDLLFCKLTRAEWLLSGLARVSRFQSVIPLTKPVWILENVIPSILSGFRTLE